ncbi:MAG: hypothetical protein K2X39_10495 [Silvanigrellaceae bacterium]|nr:hypothetical protein [Silvanigrellaceae bacterium]
MADVSESAINNISVKLREWVHDVNNALFVSKGFLEELNDEVAEKKYILPDYDHENFADMLQTVMKNVDKIDQSLHKLKKFSKEELFEILGVPKPGS